MAQIQIWQNRKTAGAVTRWLHNLSRRGVYGGRCNNDYCYRDGADWHSRASGHYYCDECARVINEMCLAQGTRKICELRL